MWNRWRNLWLRQPRISEHQIGVAMIGAKSGQKVLILGATEPSLAAVVAGVTGLNGETRVIDPSHDAGQVLLEAATSEGTLVEFERGALTDLTVHAAAFDIVVICQTLPSPAEHAVPFVQEALSAVREGGRLIVIEGTRSSILGRSRRPARPVITSTTISDALTSAGLRAVRVLAETEGVTYVEGFKRRV